MPNTERVREYKLVRGTHVRRENGKRVLYQANTDHDIILLTDSQAKSFGRDRLSPEAGKGKMPGQYQLEHGSKKTEEDEPEEIDWSFIHDESAPAVIATIEALEDIDQLEALRDTEVEGKNRKAVLKAADNRLAELAGEE